MSKHIIFKYYPTNRTSFYEVDIFQCAYDEICISLKNGLYYNPPIVQFWIPIKRAKGFSFKVNSASISNNTGSAADVINFLDSWIGDGFKCGMVQKLIFDNEKKRKTAGL